MKSKYRNPVDLTYQVINIKYQKWFYVSYYKYTLWVMIVREIENEMKAWCIYLMQFQGNFIQVSFIFQ